MIVNALNISSLNPISFKHPKINSRVPLNFNSCDVVSFGAKNIDQYQSLDLTPAEHISGIHCPSCGVAMLSKDDFYNLLKRAENIQTSEELVSLLNEHKKYIPKNLIRIFLNSELTNNCGDLSIYEYYNKCWYNALNDKKSKIYDAKKYLSDLADVYAPEQAAVILETVDKINPQGSYYDFKNNVFDMLSRLGLQSDVGAKIRKKLLPAVAESCINYNKLYLRDASSLEPGVIAKEVVSKAFNDSVSGITKVENYPDFVNDPNNDILTCNSCRRSDSLGPFWKNTNDPRLKSYINRYLGDISSLMGKGELEPIHSYLSRVCFVSNVLSKGKFNFSDDDVLRLINIRWMASRHDGFEPISQVKVDIPCAECGSTMLPHSIRHEIVDDLFLCSTPYDYAQVLKKYDKYVGSYAKQLEEIFFSIIEKEPDIPKDEFVKLFRAKVGRACSSSAYKALNKFYSDRDYCQKNRSPQELALFDLIYNRVKEFMNSGAFDDFNISDLYANCFSDIDFRDVSFNKTLCVFIDDLRRISYKYSLIRFFENRDLNDKDEVYSIVFNMFKSNVATADHLVAASKGGENTKENLVGLCKGCNNIKNKKSVASWYTQNFLVRVNFLNQLKIVDEMAKSGMLPGYENWARDVARRVYSLTYGKFDLRSNFEDIE